MSTEKRSLLLVEDDIDLVESMAPQLERNGFHVVIANNAREAMMKLKNQRFHCVITDIHLAIGSGEEVIDFLRNRRMEANTAVPILVISGFLDHELVSKIASQIDGALVKPFALKALLDKINEVALPLRP